MGLLSKILIKNNLLPKISDTESIALQAGDSWIESDIFNGKINWRNIFGEDASKLTEEEERFLENEVEVLCHLVNDWQVQQSRTIPKEAIDYIHENKFLGLQIPKSHGGLGFSSYAFSTILNKLASRNVYICLYVLIPNSVGPGELIETYGTIVQKEHYLPKLSLGEYVPCFALTEPNAGSDAVSIQANGVVFDNNGKLSIKLNFNKRYISMAPVANLIGVAFNLYDPEKLLGDKEDVGITCALVHKENQGVDMGNYHDPNGSVFPNGPVRGKDVVISVDDIIGGRDKAGHGWRMLMEALSGGRAISLPAQATGFSKQILKTTLMYSSIRQQFGISISKFQGVEEVLARMIAKAYAMEAVRNMVCKAIDQGKKPAVASAMIKYKHTEMCRESILDAMDIIAGKAIMRGPNSIVGDSYRVAPVGVTVEGANILTRTLIQFGQGAIRCHPYLYKELNALIEQNDSKLLLLFAKHMFSSIKNQFVLAINSLTRGFLIPTSGSRHKRLQQKVSWASKRFASIADLALLANGPNLKKRGSLSGRLGDCMTYLLYATAVLKKANEERLDKPFDIMVEWYIESLLYEFDKTLDEILLNFDVTGFKLLTKYFWRWTSRMNSISGGKLDKKAQCFTKSFIQGEGDIFNNVTNFLYEPSKDDNDAQSALSFTYKNMNEVTTLLANCTKAELVCLFNSNDEQKINLILYKYIDNVMQRELIKQYISSFNKIIGVDEFSKEDYEQHGMSGNSPSF